MLELSLCHPLPIVAIPRYSMIFLVPIFKNIQKMCKEWNLMEHQLALARQASLSDGARCARAASWISIQQKCTDLAGPDNQELTPLSAVKSGTFVLYWSKSTGQVKVGWIGAIYRGAVLKSKPNMPTSRRVRTTKPFPSTLPLNQCAAVRLVECIQVKQVSYRSWVANCLSRAVSWHVLARCLHC